MKLLALALLLISSTIYAAPAVPTGLTATAIQGNSATISWNSVSGATSYNLYQGSALLVNTTGNTVTVNGLTIGSSYSFGVQSVDVIGSTSAISSLLTIIAGSSGGSPGNVSNVFCVNCTPSGGVTITGSVSLSGGTITARMVDSTGIAFSNSNALPVSARSRTLDALGNPFSPTNPLHVSLPAGVISAQGIPALFSFAWPMRLVSNDNLSITSRTFGAPSPSLTADLAFGVNAGIYGFDSGGASRRIGALVNSFSPGLYALHTASSIMSSGGIQIPSVPASAQYVGPGLSVASQMYSTRLTDGLVMRNTAGPFNSFPDNTTSHGIDTRTWLVLPNPSLGSSPLRVVAIPVSSTTLEGISPTGMVVASVLYAGSPGSGTFTVKVRTIQDADGLFHLAVAEHSQDSRADTYTTTGSGQHLTQTSKALRNFAIQVKGTGASATVWDVRVEGSLDGIDFTTIATHTNTDLDGTTVWSTGEKPVLYLRSRVAGLTLAPATNIVVTILGVK